MMSRSLLSVGEANRVELATRHLGIENGIAQSGVDDQAIFKVEVSNEHCTSWNARHIDNMPIKAVSDTAVIFLNDVIFRLNAVGDVDAKQRVHHPIGLAQMLDELIGPGVADLGGNELGLIGSD